MMPGGYSAEYTGTILAVALAVGPEPISLDRARGYWLPFSSSLKAHFGAGQLRLTHPSKSIHPISRLLA